MSNTVLLPEKISLVIVALHLNAIFNFVLGSCILFLSCILFITGFLQDDLSNFDELLPGILALTVLFGSAGMLFAQSAFIEFVVLRLKQGYRWAWIAALVVSILNIFSILFILGVVGLVGLFDTAVIAHSKSRRGTRS